MILGIILGVFFLLLIIYLVSTRKEKIKHQKAKTQKSQLKASTTNELQDTGRYHVSESSVCSYSGLQIGICKDDGVVLIGSAEYLWNQILLCKTSRKTIYGNGFSNLGKDILLGGVIGVLTGDFSGGGSFASASSSGSQKQKTIHYLHLVQKGGDEKNDVTVCFGEVGEEAEKACSMIQSMLKAKREEQSGSAPHLAVQPDYDIETLYDVYTKFRAFIQKNEQNMNLEKHWQPMLQLFKTLKMDAEWIIGKEPESSVYYAYPSKYNKHKVFDTPLYDSLFERITLSFSAVAIWEAYLLYKAKLFEHNAEDCDFLFSGHGYRGDEATPSIDMNEDGTFLISHLICDENDQVLKIVTGGRYNPFSHTVSFQDLTFQKPYTLEEKLDAWRRGERGIPVAEDDVNVELWLPEMNSVNITLFCDHLLNKPENHNGIIAIWLKKEDIGKVGFKSLEMQSSGFKVIKKIDLGLYVSIVIQASKDQLKKELSIPYLYEDGFGWGKQIQDDEACSVKKIPVSNYHQEYILNFSVAEEYNLQVIFFPADTRLPQLIYENDSPC